MVMRYGAAVVRAAAWLGLVLLAVASLTPGEDLVRSGIPTKLEHVVAYCLATAVWMLAYARWPHAAVAALFVSYAGVLEIAQHWVPGRTAQATDFLASGSGVVIGLLAGTWCRGRFGAIMAPTDNR